MKKLSLIFCLALICFSLLACNSGKTNNAVVKIGDSTRFSKKEIQTAVNCVITKFKDFKGCDLKTLSYDENESNLQIEAYMSNGKGSINKVNKENVIVLLSNFYVNASGVDEGFNPNSTYTDWKWILIRDSKTGSWKVDDWGY